MMQDFLIWFYQLLHGIQDDPLWDEVYVISFVLLLIVTLVVLVVYYRVITSYYINWFKTKYWFLFMIVNSFLVALINYIVAITTIEGIKYSKEFLTFAIINFIYALGFYLVFSIFMRRFSRHARYTPSLVNFFSKSKKS